ncbi:MAG: D-inositol-3-phosphate glycosyltransferase, partial [Pseudonocardiales bacterium]|nr:D-inositol-3-phosphate glycosyltransferase [Pseudonocardiales bacterium]
VDWYGADPDRVQVVPPGVDLEVFSPVADRSAARDRVGVAQDALVLLFVGRLQPLKAPDVLIRAAARIVETQPSLAARLQVLVVGAPSGTGLADPDALQKLAAELGIAGHVRFEPPASRELLADFYRAADLTVVPSYNESFGLVALESQACATPVIAADVGGLSTAVRDGETGLLVDNHRSADWADRITDLLRDSGRRAEFGRAAREHAQGFSWRHTADGLLVAYSGAIAGFGSLLATGSDDR